MNISNQKNYEDKLNASKLNTIANSYYRLLLTNSAETDIVINNILPFKLNGAPDIKRYAEFCELYRQLFDSFRMANAIGGNDFDVGQLIKLSPGTGFINSMVTLATLFLNKANHPEKKDTLYYCLNMTLKDYWNAIISSCANSDSSIDEKRIKRLITVRDEFMHGRDYNTRLKDAIGDLLNDYQRAYRYFGMLQNIIDCEITYREYMENPFNNPLLKRDNYGSDPLFYEYEEDQLFDYVELPLELFFDDYYNSQTAILLDENPEQYYLAKANSYSIPYEDCKTHNSKLNCKALLLDQAEYTKDSLKSLNNSIQTKSFHDLFEKITSSEEFRTAGYFIGKRAYQIYQLLVIPYLRLLNYHFEASSNHCIN